MQLSKNNSSSPIIAFKNGTLKRLLLLYLALLLCLLSSVALAVNYFTFHYIGNNYFPSGMGVVGVTLLLTFIGVFLLFSENSFVFQINCELVYIFLVFSVIAFATNAVQYTPYQPIDDFLVKIDRSLGIDTSHIMAWISYRPWLRYILALCYDSLAYQLCLLPIILTIGKKFNELREFYALLIITALVGFTFYYFFPTQGPASIIESPYFMKEQYDTGIKFLEIHQHKTPSTLSGGLIAMPSFHVIWAWLCLYLVRVWPLIFFLLLPINMLLICSCILLGWHYFIDFIGSCLVLAFSFSFCKYLTISSEKVRGDNKLNTNIANDSASVLH